MNDERRLHHARRLIEACRIVLAWDDVPKTVPSFTSLRNIIDTGKDIASLLRSVSEKVFKNLDRHIAETTKALEHAYIGKGKLKYGLPDTIVASLVHDATEATTKLNQLAIREARVYDTGKTDALASALVLLPMTELIATIAKKAGQYRRLGSAAFAEANDAVQPSTAASFREARAHDTQMIRALESQVLPWLATQSGGKEFPAADMKALALRLAKKLMDDTVRHSTDELLSNYRVEKMASMRQLLVFAMLGVTLRTLETIELRAEQKAKVFVQFALPKLRDQQRQETQQKRKDETSTETEEKPT